MTKKNLAAKPSRGIRIQLILAFLMPILCIIVLGAVSYTIASNGIISNYEASIKQTMDMTGQYYAFTLKTVEAAIDQYYSDRKMTDFYSGLFDLSSTYETQFFSSTQENIKEKARSDDYIENIYILSDEKPSMLSSSVRFGASADKDKSQLYSSFMNTSQGAGVVKDPGNFYFFGAQPELDGLLSAKTENYFIRVARKFKNSDTCIIVDINRKKLKDMLGSLNSGNESLLGIVTPDGQELLDDTGKADAGNSGPTGKVFFDKGFYQEAVSAEELSGFQYVDYNQQTYLFVFSKVGGSGVMICSLFPKELIIGQASTIKSVTFGIVLLACLLALVICSLIAGRIGKTLNHMASGVKKVTQGDLTVEIKTQRKDEFGLLAHDINNMIRNMRFLVEKVKDTGTELITAANQVSESSRTFVDTARDIKCAISDIEKGITQLDENSEDSLVQMEALSGRIVLVNENTSHIYSITDSTAQAISRGFQTMNELNDTTKSNTEITQHVIETIELLDSRTKSIGQIVNVINDIARQTNLLSLNASIESARAGASGRGFAVVADEIRKLADQSLQAAKSIHQIIEEINRYTSESVEATKQARDIVKLQEDAVKNSTQSFYAMEQQIDTLLIELKSILNSIENMEQARATTSGAIESISAVSEETTACAATVGTTAEKQLDVVIQLDSAAGHLLNRATDLGEAINLFKVG